MNYFTLLKLDENYELDIQDLRKKYLDMQLKHHPDKANSNEEPAKYDISIELNKAFITLKDYLLRAEYLLSLKGFSIENLRDFDNVKLVNNFWESLESLENNNDIGVLRETYGNKIKEKELIITHLKDSFKTENMKLALYYTASLKYIDKLIKIIEEKIDNN